MNTEMGSIERSIVNPRVWVPVTEDRSDSSCFLYAGTKRQALQYFGWPGDASLRLERDGEDRVIVWGDR